MASTDGVICSDEDYQRFLQDGTSIHCLTRGESLGLMLVAQTGIVSLLAVFSVFGIILRNVLRRKRAHGDWRLFEEPTDLILTSLFLIDGVQAVGAILNIAWLNRGKVEIGGYCQSQGIIKQYGEVGVAFNTTLVALYTFIGLWVGRPIRSMRKTIVLVILAWVIPFFIVLISNVTTKNFHGPVPLWCWITKYHATWRIMGEYFWLWLALGICLLMYIPIYFWNRGNFVPRENTWWKFRIRSAKCSQIDLDLRRKASVMLLYPLAYAIVVIPLTVVRFITFAREKYDHPQSMDTSATVLAGVLFASSGAINVVLFLRTRPDTALFKGHTETAPLPSTHVTHRAFNRLTVSNWLTPETTDPPSTYEERNHNSTVDLGRLPSLRKA